MTHASSHESAGKTRTVLVAPTLNASAWDELLQNLREQRPDLFRAWFRELRPGSLAHGVLEVLARNDAQRHYLETNCRQAFAAAVQLVTGRLVSAVFIADPIIVEEPPSGRLRPFCLRAEFTFDRLVEGECNRLATTAAKAVSARPGEAYNPLFVHGSTGTGKTHLLHAIQWETLRLRADAAVVYADVNGISNALIQALENDALPSFRADQEQADIWVLDDVDQLAGRTRTQDEVHRLFDVLHAAGVQMVFAGKFAPGELRDVQPRLQTRFASGLVAALDLPEFETRLAILRHLCAARGLDDDEVLRCIATRIDQGANALKLALDRVEAACSARGRPISLELADDALEEDTLGPVTLRAILDSVAQSIGLSPEEIRGKARSRAAVRARLMVLYLARMLSAQPLAEIGRYFGNRHPQTVLHAVQRFEGMLKSDLELERLVGRLSRELRSPAFLPTGNLRSR